MEAGNDFFNTDGQRVAASPTTRRRLPAPITGATLLSGAAGHQLAEYEFRDRRHHHRQRHGRSRLWRQAPAGNQLNVTDNIQTLLTKIDSITGTSTPSTISGGVISAAHRRRREPDGHQFEHSPLLRRSALAPAVTAAEPPLRVGTSPLGTATTLVNGLRPIRSPGTPAIPARDRPAPRRPLGSTCPPTCSTARGQRAGHSLAASNDSRFRRGQHNRLSPVSALAGRGAQRTRRAEPCVASGATTSGGHSVGSWQRRRSR